MKKNTTMSMVDAVFNFAETDKMARLVAKHGEFYVGAMLPPDIERGETGDCYDHCMLEVMKNWPKYEYVEGYARVMGGDLVMHAWLTDGVRAFDPTWQVKKGQRDVSPHRAIEYYGVPMSFRWVAEFVKATGYKAVIANRAMNFDLAERAMKLKTGALT